MINTKANLVRYEKHLIDWLPKELDEKYHSTNLDYEFCLKLFMQLEAAKRDTIPRETMRQWFMEFIRKGWTKKVVQARYDALISSKIYGNAIKFDDWVMAVPVFGADEVNILVQQRINTMIQRGRSVQIKGRELELPELTEEDKIAHQLAAANEILFYYQNQLYEAIEVYKEQVRKDERKKVIERKKKILSLDIEGRIRVVKLMVKNNVIGEPKSDDEFGMIVKLLEEYAFLVKEEFL